MSIAFLLTSLAMVATPGTGAILTIAAGLRAGHRTSVVTAFGCTLGIVPVVRRLQRVFSLSYLGVGAKLATTHR